MKSYKLYLLIFLIAASLITILVGCEYDVAVPAWEKAAASTIVASIDSIVPANEAAAGVNIITIYGKNFTGALDTSVVHTFAGRDSSIAYNGVYFDKLPANIIEVTPTYIKVRRPNMVNDSSVVQVTPNIALIGAKKGPYKIDSVRSRMNKFLTNVELSVVAVDNLGNCFITQRFAGTARTPLWMITPSGTKSLVDTLRTLSAAPQEGRISPLDGMLYLVGNAPLKTNRAIRSVNLTTGAVNNNWLTLTAAHGVLAFDFDANGNIYAGGTNTSNPNPASWEYSGLVVVTPAKVATYTSYYTTDIIQAITVYQGYLYVAYKTGSAPAKIARHTVDASGNVGAQQVVLDLSTTGSAFSTRVVKSIMFSSSGTMYLGCSSVDPFLVLTTPIGVSPQVVDYFYKGIIPESNKFASCWGNGTNLYLIGGNGQTGNEYDLYQVDMGITVGSR